MSNSYIIMNGVTFYPTSIDVDEEKIEEEVRMADGTLRKVFRAVKNTWDISWNGLPEELLPAIRTLYRLTTTFTLTDVDGNSFTVMSSTFNHSLSAEKKSIGGKYYYDVSLQIKQV